MFAYFVIGFLMCLIITSIVFVIGSDHNWLDNEWFIYSFSAPIMVPLLTIGLLAGVTYKYFRKMRNLIAIKLKRLQKMR